MYQAAVVTVSDRSFRGQRPDGAGPVVAQMLREAGYPVAIQTIVPDEQPIIEETLKNIADSGRVQLLVTTGGTGFSPRDVTPEATIAVCHRLAPGIPEAMRYASPQSRPGKPGRRPAHPPPRPGNALRRNGGLRKVTRRESGGTAALGSPYGRAGEPAASLRGRRQ